jgi:hypothetical protein
VANERRRRGNFLSGTITDNPLASGATTVNGAALANVEAIDANEHMLMILDADGSGNGPEVCYITAHTASATSATIVRGREGTTGVSHVSGTDFLIGPVSSDWLEICTTSTRPSGNGLPYHGQVIFDDDLDAYLGYSAALASWEPISVQVKQTRTAITANRDWTSSTPAAIPTNSCAVSFTKRGTSSALLATIVIPRIAAVTVVCSVSLYARIGSTNYEVVDLAALPVDGGGGAGSVCISGSRLITGIAAGSTTVTLYGSRDTDTARIGTGTTDELTVTEIPV